MRGNRMHYFAYGSNMDLDRMRGRCPSARFLFIAMLPQHKLAFTRKCNKGTGVSDIVSDENSDVWGVVYLIDDTEVGKLEKAEGYEPRRESNAYNRIEIRVYADGNLEQPHTAIAYVVNVKEVNVPNPSQEYKNYIVNGARFWHLPEVYIHDTLETIEAFP